MCPLKKKVNINSPQVGEIYYHYRDRRKERPYIILHIALREESEKVCVIYQAQYGEQLTWDRTLEDWSALVEYEGVNIPRFRRA